MNVNNIENRKISDDEKRWRRYYREVMTAIGLLPGFYDGGISEKVRTEKRLSPERFSTNYKIREDFEKDRIIIADYILEGKYAPEDLVQKVAETVKELDLKFGE